MMEDGRFDLEVDGDLSKVDLSELGQEASIVRFVNQIIAEADRQEATDIHFEPMETELRIRYRIDGMLHKVDVPPQLNRLKAAITSRLKVMANLDIAEKRLPMDGRIGIRVNGQDLDIRVSTMPTTYGESVSLRLLQKSGNFVKMGDLGMRPEVLEQIDRIIHRPNGIVLVTGPTGSGKTTSLYAFLHEINRMDVRILTAEDPIEYEMPGINQVAVKSDIGLTFARILRSFLRQDPDIVMVSEIRDSETAEIAINASLTGHLVLSTLHQRAVKRFVRRSTWAWSRSGGLGRGGGRGAAPCAPPLHRLLQARAAGGEALRQHRPAGLRQARRADLRVGRLRGLRPDRLPRPRRHLRAAAGDGRDRVADHRARLLDGDPRQGAGAGHVSPARRRLAPRAERQHLAGGGASRVR